MSRCANIRSPFFKDLVKESGIDSMELESHVTKWMNEFNEDRIPTLTELHEILRSKPIKFSDFLYTHYNLLNKDGSIKLFKTNQEIEAAKKWIKFNNENANYTFKLRDTEKGKRIFIYEKEQSKEAFQTESQGVPDNQLDSKIKDSLKKMGVELAFVDTITDNDGNIIKDVVARAKYVQNGLKKLIEVVKGKAGLDTITEEAAHNMVWMLRGSHLYNSMMNDIHKFPEYKQVLTAYKDKYTTDLQFKEEAIAKIITQRVIALNKTDITAEQFTRANSWFKRVLSWFKNKVDKYFEDPYNKAAGKLLFGDVSGLSNKNISDKAELYQIDNKRQEAISKIKTLADELRKKGNDLAIVEVDGKRTYTEKGFNYGISVTEQVDKELGAFNNKDLNEIQKIKYEFQRLFGTDGHDDFDNALTRVIEEKQGAIKTPKIIKLDEESYKKIEDFAKKLVNSYPADAEFFIEQKVGDKNFNKGKGIAGTLDFFVIYVDDNNIPKLDILDWKFVNYNKDGKKVVDIEINRTKKQHNQSQLIKYRDILKTYGIDFQSKVRIMPISINVNSEFDKERRFIGYKRGSIEVASLEYNGTALHLNPVPLETEKTGNETVDNIIKNLVAQRNSVEKMTITTPVERANQQRRLTKLNEVIKELILTSDIKSFLQDASSLIDSYNKEDLTKTEAIFASQELLPFYKNLNTSFYEDNLSKAQFDTIVPFIDAFKRKVDRLDTFLTNKLKEDLVDIANGIGVEDINEPQKDITVWQKLEKQLSQQNSPKLKALYELIIQAKDKTIKVHKELHDKIKTSTEKIIKYAAANGIDATKAFDFMLVKDKKGNLKQISKYKKEIWEDIRNAKATKDVSKIRKYFDFDAAAYEEGAKENLEYWTESYKYLDVKSRKDALDRKKKEFEANHDIRKNITGYFTKYNRYLKLKDAVEYFSPEYKHIQETPELKEFYDLFNSTVNESREWLDADIEGHFVPQIPVGYIEQISKTGIESFSKMKDIFINSLTAKQQGLYGEINSNSGEIYKSIPVYYTQHIGEDASNDLGKVLSLWVDMAYNNKHLQEVEGSINILYEALKQEEFIQTDIFGKEKVIDGETVITKALNSHTLEAFRDYMNEALYGINVSHKDKVFETTKKRTVIDSEGKESVEEYTVPISGMKVFGKLMTLTSTKALALNFIGAGANLTGNVVNGFYEGVKGIYYGKEQFVKSIGMIATGNVNPVVQTLMRYFDIMDDMEVFNKADALSVYKANHFFTQDKAFALYKSGDHLAMNGILMSMLQTHGINTVTNKIEHIRNLPEGTKSIFDSAEIVDGKLHIAGMTDVESEKMFRNFRRRVFEIGKRVTGLAPSYDIRLINQTVLGKAAMTFRNWIPRMLDERTGALVYNKNLEAYEEGKHRTTVNFLLQKGLVDNAMDLMKYSIGIGNLEEKLKIKYQTLTEKEKLKVSEQDYIALQKGNIRSSLMEMQMVLAIFALLFALKPGDDDDREQMGAARKYTIKMLDKLFNEVSFFVNPASAESIIGSPFPVTRTIKDVYLLGKHLLGEGVGEITGDEEMMKKYKPLKYISKQFPYSSQLGNTWGIISDDKYWVK